MLGVTPRIDSASETTVNIEYSVSEGVQSTVELINITGNDQTLDKVIRRELAIAPEMFLVKLDLM